VLEKVHKKIGENIYWIKKIKTAIEEDRFVPYFQTLYKNQTNKIEKYEGLIRMVEEDGEIISPWYFLEISKNAKYYHQLTRIMIEKSFDAFKDREEGFSINLACGDIENKEMREYIITKLEENPSMAKRLVFELLEDEPFHFFDVLKSFVHEVKSYGVKIAIDDFGSGYSNFTRLMDFQPDILKIDGSLIKNILRDDFSMSIVTTMQLFADKLGIKTVAEFVSAQEIQACIKEIGIE